MEGDGVNSSLRYFSIYLLFTGILCLESISPGPEVYVLNGSNVTFSCNTTKVWNTIYFYDKGISESNLPVVIFQGNSTHCRTFAVSGKFGADKYSALSCNVGQPVSIIVRYINASYHDKIIQCRFDPGTLVNTIIKIRKELSKPDMIPNGIKTIKENVFYNFTCTAKSIPKPTIKWYLGGSVLTVSAPMMSSTGMTTQSTMMYHAKKEHNKKKLYCSATDTFRTLNSSFANLNILYIPEISTDPIFNPYILYQNQQNVNLTCKVDRANPESDISFTWNFPNGSTVNNQIVTLKSVEKTNTGNYSCTATNLAGQSNAWKKEILVQYEPLISNISNTSIIEGKTLNVIPNVDGNPAPVSVWWTRKTFSSFRDENLILTINRIQRNASGEYTCHASNVLRPSGMSPMSTTSEKNINIDVLYVPEIHTEPKYAIYVLYHKQKDIVLNCVLDNANPSVGTIYKWQTPNDVIVQQNVTIRNVEMSNRGEYSCTAENVAGKSSAGKIQIDVQYGPSISNIAPQEDIIEGNNLTVVPTVDAYPSPGYVWWTRQNDATYKYEGSTLMIENVRRDDTDNYTCYAMNTLTPSGIEDMNRTAKFVFYINVQYPPSTEIAEAPMISVVENDTVTLHCNVKDANPILSSMLWYQYSNRTLKETANYTIKNIHRSAAGNYTCEARNRAGNGTTSININVLYGPIIKKLMVINGSTTHENSSVFLQCEVESNPVPYIEWMFNNKPLNYDGSILGSSYMNITAATCYHTGIYRCKANNTIFENVYNDSKEVQLFVNCSPRLNKDTTPPPNKIGLPLRGALNISVDIVAYPELTASDWIFTQYNTTNVTYKIKSDNESNSFRHIIHLFKPNLTETDFGDYLLEVQNNVGSMTYTFNVVPEGPPEPSTLINATCGIHTALLYWVTSFSGGDSQNFSVIIIIGESKNKNFKTNVVSNRKGEIKYTSLNLSPGDYTFSILGENKYNSAISINQESCQVKDYSKAENTSIIAAAAGGGVGGAVTLITVILIILFIIKKRKILKKGKHFEESRTKLTDEETEEGLKDNPLYGTSQNTKDDSGPMYSVVNKKSASHDCKEEGSVYSQVQKKSTKGNKPMEIEMGSVYENSDMKMKSKEKDEIYANTKTQNKNGCNFQLTKNKDGLIYADLDLAPSGTRFIIHGTENRNNYAIIDLSKTAEPLPSDDEDVSTDNNDTESVNKTDEL